MIQELDRSWRCARLIVVTMLILSVFLSPPGHGVIIFRSGDPLANTSAPTGDLAGSGWDLQGVWGGFLGTPISSRHFITAGHVGGSIGQTFTYQGSSYATTAFFDDPETDLRIWEVDGVFAEHASLYTGSTEAGEGAVVFGRGGGRGSEVMGPALLGGTELKGWRWSSGDTAQRWGENVIESVFDGGAGLGELLVANFDALGLDDEATLSTGDSGGGLFINDGGLWKLAGIHYAVDGPFNTSASGDGFDAAIFDEGGLYQKNAEGEWVLTLDQFTDIPASFYSTRISSREDWILATIPEPESYGAVGAGLLVILILWRHGRRRISRNGASITAVRP